MLISRTNVSNVAAKCSPAPPTPRDTQKSRKGRAGGDKTQDYGLKWHVNLLALTN